MRSTFDELAKELAELRAFVASVGPVNSALAGNQDPNVRQYLTIRRRFDYAAFVVALYVSIEKFAENLVAAYARLVALQVEYSALPTALTDKHMTKSAEILFRGQLGKGRYIGVRELDVVKNLFDCLSGQVSYALNTTALVAHEANLRYDELGNLFVAVGIKQDGVLRADAMISWFCTLQDLPEPPEKGVPIATVKERLDELVERRNQVTHRGNPDNLLGADEMNDLVGFVEALASSIFALTVAEYLRGRHAGPHAVPLELLEGPFQNRKVVVVRTKQRLYVGQPIFAFVEGARVRWGRILSLMINDLSVTNTDEAETAEGVGVEVGFKCPRGVELFVLDVDDDVVWGPQ